MNGGFYKSALDKISASEQEQIKSGILSDSSIIPSIWKNGGIDDTSQKKSGPVIIFHRHFDKQKPFDHENLRNKFYTVTQEVPNGDKKADIIIEFIDENMDVFYGETPLSDFGINHQGANLRRIYETIAKKEPESFPKHVHVSPKLRTIQTFRQIFDGIISYEDCELDKLGRRRAGILVGTVGNNRTVEISLDPKWREVGPEIILPSFILSALLEQGLTQFVLDKIKSKKSPEWEEIKRLLMKQMVGGGKIITDAKERIRNAVREITNIDQTNNQVVISHGEILECLLDDSGFHRKSGDDTFRTYFRTRTGSTTILAMDNGKLKLGAYNLCTSKQH